MRNYTRRRFISRCLATTGVLAAADGPTAWSRVRGANDAVRIAIVGLRKKGRQHIDIFPKIPDVRITALCDADTEFLDYEVANFKRRNQKVATYVDYRKLLEDKNIDVVVIVAPDHWHGLMTVWACQAGKDVYVEKPLAHNIWEGRKMIEAARKYKRIVQVGSQNRSDVGLREAVPWIRAGNLGKVLLARAFSGGPREGIGKVSGPQPIPPTCDYNLFQGPAPLVPLMRKNLHYDWHWFWDTGTGECGNLGAHELDQTLWILDQTVPPRRVMSIGGRYGWDDNGQTPNTQVVWLDYEPVPILYEIRNLTRAKGDPRMEGFRGIRAGTRIECEEGFFAGGRGGGWAYDKNGKKIKQFKGDGGADHQENFIEAARSRKVTDLRADVAQGHNSAILCHMTNISYRIGRRCPASEMRERIHGNAALTESFDRMVAHLDANRIDLGEQLLTAGAMVSLDAERERFVGEFSEWANMFVRRDCRSPFVVPEVV